MSELIKQTEKWVVCAQEEMHNMFETCDLIAEEKN